MKMVAGVGELDFPALFKSAKRRIILHAAIYGPFSKSEVSRQALEYALENSDFLQLDIIALHPDNKSGWVALFMQALRSGFSEEELEGELTLSQNFIEDLAQKHPEKVLLHPLLEQPFQPIVIVDNVICFGQYAHASVPAPEGFWAMVEVDVEKLFSWLAVRDVPPEATAENIAAFRMISECARAMRQI